MATGLLALLDDITSILDDVAALSKVAAQKTAGIAGDDLAVNAEGLVGLAPARELPIVGQVALGSVANKFVLVPLALALPASMISPLLMIGGTFLCYEGVHKVIDKVFHAHDKENKAHEAELLAAAHTSADALKKVERTKVRQAILTDIVLSAEIVAVALGAVADEPFATKAITLSIVSLGMTAAIYGLVAGLVKLDDIGLWLKSRKSDFSSTIGQWMIVGTPILMRVVSVVGTVAMFMVGGGILMHGLHAEEPLHHFIAERLTTNGFLTSTLETLTGALLGVVVGAVAVAIVEGIKWIFHRVRGTTPAAH